MSTYGRCYIGGPNDKVFLKNSPMDKEYGKFTLEQFQRLIKKLPEVRSEMAELLSLIKAASPEKLVEVLGDGFHWAEVYELAFIKTVALLFVAFGRKHSGVA